MQKEKKRTQFPVAYYFYFEYARYFTEYLITESLMLSEIGSQLTYSPISRKNILMTYSYSKKKSNIPGAEGDREANSQNHII